MSNATSRFLMLDDGDVLAASNGKAWFTLALDGSGKWTDATALVLDQQTKGGVTYLTQQQGENAAAERGGDIADLP